MNGINKRVEAIPHSYLAKLLPFFIKKKRLKVIRENIERMFGNKLTEVNKKKLELGFYRHTILFIYEFIVFNLLPKRMALKRFILHGEEHLIKAAKQGKGIIILTGHLGNFEVCLTFMKVLFKVFNQPLYCIRKPLSRSWLGKYIINASMRHGAEIIYSTSTLRKTLNALKKNSAIILTLDQCPSKKNSSALVLNFFNIPTKTHSSLAKIQNTTKAPIVPMAMHRNSKGKHIINFHPQITVPSQTTDRSEKLIFQSTQQYNQILEKFIKEHPEQWIYDYKRWR